MSLHQSIRQSCLSRASLLVYEFNFNMKSCITLFVGRANVSGLCSVLAYCHKYWVKKVRGLFVSCNKSLDRMSEISVVAQCHRGPHLFWFPIETKWKMCLQFSWLQDDFLCRHPYERKRCQRIVPVSASLQSFLGSAQKEQWVFLWWYLPLLVTKYPLPFCL